MLPATFNAVVPDFQEAEDLLQDVAVILLRKFPEYDAQRPFVARAIGMAKREVIPGKYLSPFKLKPKQRKR